MSVLIPLAGLYIGYKIGEENPGCCCITAALIGICYYGSGSHNSKKPANEDVQQVEPKLQEVPVKQENNIDPFRIDSNTPKTNLQLENVIDPYTNKASSFLLRQIRNYQENIGPRLKEELHTDRLCRYEPSCSEYAKQAIEKYGSARGTSLAIGRLLRCNPWSKGGSDPVT